MQGEAGKTAYDQSNSFQLLSMLTAVSSQYHFDRFFVQCCLDAHLGRVLELIPLMHVWAIGQSEGMPDSVHRQRRDCTVLSSPVLALPNMESD